MQAKSRNQRLWKQEPGAERSFAVGPWPCSAPKTLRSEMNANPFLLVPAVLAGLTGAAQAASHCESMAAVNLPNTTLTIAQLVPAGTFQPPTGAAQQNLP